MKIDASADHPITRMYRSEETADRIGNRVPEEQAAKVRTSGRMKQSSRDSVKIGSQSRASFSTQLNQGLSKPDKAMPDPAVRKSNPAGRPETPVSQTSTPGSTEKSSTDTGGGKSNIVSTPIGVFDLSTKGPNKYVSLTGISEMRTYFMTHQPADWMYNDKARAEFAKIYGENALVTLDWDGTVPENLDSVWVTQRPIGPDGRPLPGNKSSNTLT